jgi:hypothetical protein
MHRPLTVIGMGYIPRQEKQKRVSKAGYSPKQPLNNRQGYNHWQNHSQPCSKTPAPPQEKAAVFHVAI